MEQKSGSLIEWIVPLAFILTFGWLTWHAPAFVMDWGGFTDTLLARYSRNDLTPGLPALFAHADIIDYIALVLTPILFVVGMATVRRAPMEFEAWGPADRMAIFIGRVTMLLITLMTSVMLYEVLVRYVFEAPTLWANELSLWLAGFVFLCAGLYAMQQRSHIRIYIIYDVMPRFMQKICDVISTTFIVIFAMALIYGGYNEAVGKFLRWEPMGTAFDPPLPATIKPMILIVITLVAIQAIINLISDWNTEPVIHTAADDIDEDEIAALKKAAGVE